MENNDISRAILILEKHIEDDKTIARLNFEVFWLAQQLAMSGADPSYPPDNGYSETELVSFIADRWVAAAERIGVEKCCRQAST